MGEEKEEDEEEEGEKQKRTGERRGGGVDRTAAARLRFIFQKNLFKTS